MSHVYHDRAEWPGAIVFPDCDECAQVAEHPYRLDRHNLRRAWLRMIDVERLGEHYATEVEARLCRRLYSIAVIVERLWGDRFDPFDPTHVQ